nr:hypothetical protein pmam_252 [Pithovirus mammoth]
MHGLLIYFFGLITPILIFLAFWFAATVNSGVRSSYNRVFCF